MHRIDRRTYWNTQIFAKKISNLIWPQYDDWQNFTRIVTPLLQTAGLEKKEELTTGWRDDLVEQLHVRPLPYLLYDRTQFFVRLVDISCRWQHDENDRKKNVCTLDIAPLRSESSAQKRSGMNWHLFSRDLTVLPAHPHVQSAIGMSHTCLCLSWYSSTDSGGMEGWVGRTGADRRRTDSVGCRGGCNSAVTVRVRSALKKFREYLPILAG